MQQLFRKASIVSLILESSIALLLIGLILNAIAHGSDFHVFYKTAQRILNGSEIYVLADGSDPFKYHPAWAYFFAPLALFPEKVSLAIFTIIQISCWIYGIKISASWLNYDWKNSKNFLFLLLLSLNAFSAETGFGQINGFLFVSTICVVAWVEESNKPIRAGFLIALMVALKLNFAIMIFYAFFKNKRALLGLFCGAIFLHLVIYFKQYDLFNVTSYQNWLALLLGQSTGQYFTYEVQGFLRFFQVAFGESLARIAWIFLLLIFICFGCYFQIRKVISQPAAIASYWLSGIFFFSPLAWWYQILFVFPMAFCLLKAPLSKVERNVIKFCLLVFALASFSMLGRENLIYFKTFLGFFIFAIIIFVIFLKRSLVNGDFTFKKESNVGSFASALIT